MTKHKKLLKRGAWGALVFSLLIFVFAFLSIPDTHAQGGSNPAPPPAPVQGTPPNPSSQTPAAGDPQQTGDEDDGTTCAIEKVGWILCPLMETAAKISDSMFDVLANNFLRTDPALISDQNNGTKAAWDIARNLANVMFIAAFIIIILSQVTGQGLTNYGIKRMLPRLIIAAIAVNVSYYICQLAVDITNIMGYEIQNALEGIADELGPSIFGQAAQYNSTFETGSDTSQGILTVIVVAALAAAAVVWFIIGPALAVITAVIITVLAILVILMLRKALIVLLIVVSPIAFVMYLLPNTEKFFNKWMKMFGQLLMVFPVVGLLFGAGQLASTIILVAGAAQAPPTTDVQNCDPNNPQGQGNQANTQNNANPGNQTGYTGTCDGYVSISGSRDPNNTKHLSAVPWTLGLTATGVAIAPLMAVYAVLKGALSAAGAIGGWINTNASRMGRGGGNLAGKLDKRRQATTQAAWQRTQARALENRSTGVIGGIARRRARRNERLGRSKADVEREEQQYITRVLGNEDARTAITQGLTQAGQSRAASDAIAQEREREVKERAAAHTEVDNLTVGTRGVDWDTGGQAGAQAQELIAEGNFDSPHLAALLEHLGKTNQQAFMNLASQLGGHGASAATRAAAGVMAETGLYGGGQVADMQHGRMAANTNLLDMARTNVEGGALSPAELAKMSNDKLRTLDEVIATTAAARNSVVTARDRLSADQENNLGGDKMARLANFGPGRLGR